MKRIVAIALAVMLIVSLTVPVYAVTPALKIPNVPQISKIQFSIRLDEKLEKAVAEAVKKIDSFKLFAG